MTAFGVVPERPGWREVGRVTGTEHPVKYGGPSFASTIRVATDGTSVMIGIGTRAVVLDAAAREDFARLWFEACRQVEGDDP